MWRFAAGQFGVGCWICNRASVNTSFAKFGCVPTQAADVSQHCKYKKHLAALQQIQNEENEPAEPSEMPGSRGVVSGLSDDVPRLDTWVNTLNGVLTRASFSSADTASVCNSMLGSGKDASRTVTRQILQCAQTPLNEEDRYHMRHAVMASLAIDKGDEYLVVYARTLSKHGLYDFLVGIDSDTAADSDCPDAARKVLQALKRVLTRACVVRGTGRRTSCYSGEDDAVDPATLDNFLKSIRSAVADGSAVEQRALFEASPLLHQLTDAPGDRQALFENCCLITRDRAHRLRSVDKGFWKALPPVFGKFMKKMITGERSLAKLLETSEKFSKAFVAKQKESEATNGPSFANLLRSFSYADHRFSSRKRPLFRLFRLLVTVIDTLEYVASAHGPWDESDRKWAGELLELFSGDEGYNRVVSAALVGDIMITAWPMLRVCDADHSDFALHGCEAADCLEKLRHLLLDGAIWLPDASGTLTHSVLLSIRERLVMVGRGTAGARALSIGWPVPGELRQKPIQIAKESLASSTRVF